MKAYTILGWIVWQIGKWIAVKKMAQNRVKKMAQNRVKLGAAGTVLLVLIGGVIAAKAASGDD